MELISLIVPALIALAVIILLASGYTKAPPDMAYIISGVRKKPRISALAYFVYFNVARRMSAALYLSGYLRGRKRKARKKRVHKR